MGQPRTILVLLFMGLTGCASASVAFDNKPLDIATTHREITPRVREDGWELTCSLTAQGLSGQGVDVSCYDDQNRFLAVTQVQPPDNTHTDGVKLFVPFSRIYNLPNKLAFNLFATPAQDRSEYLVKGHWDLINESHGVRILWALKQFEEGVTLADGQHGIRLTMQLNTAGYLNHPLQAVAVVRNADLTEISPTLGGPIVIDQMRLNPNYDDCQWNELVISIPYSRLALMPPTAEIAITPSIRDGDTLYTGNVHFSAFAGGTFQEIQDAAEKDVAACDQQINDLQKQIDDLNKERGQ